MTMLLASPALDRPEVLTPADRVLLRKLDRKGPALSLGFEKGWMLAGTRYTDKAVSKLSRFGLTHHWRDDDGVKIMLNDTGRVVAERISPSRPVVDLSSPDTD